MGLMELEELRQAQRRLIRNLRERMEPLSELTPQRKQELLTRYRKELDEVRQEKLRVMVHVFGRATPVVLDYTNVEKA